MSRSQATRTLIPKLIVRRWSHQSWNCHAIPHRHRQVLAINELWQNCWPSLWPRNRTPRTVATRLLLGETAGQSHGSRVESWAVPIVCIQKTRGSSRHSARPSRPQQPSDLGGGTAPGLPMGRHEFSVFFEREDVDSPCDKFHDPRSQKPEGPTIAKLIGFVFESKMCCRNAMRGREKGWPSNR
jgi:hypothetical protein